MLESLHMEKRRERIEKLKVFLFSLSLCAVQFSCAALCGKTDVGTVQYVCVGAMHTAGILWLPEFL